MLTSSFIMNLCSNIGGFFFLLYVLNLSVVNLIKDVLIRFSSFTEKIQNRNRSRELDYEIRL